jgi:hypothetical protein
MLDFSMQLRAQKEAERRSKSESAEMLNKYRGSGMKEEEIQARIQKKEMRKKQKETEENLHSYKDRRNVRKL